MKTAAAGRHDFSLVGRCSFLKIPYLVLQQQLQETASSPLTFADVMEQAAVCRGLCGYIVLT